MDWVCGAVNDEKEDEYKEKMTLTGANNIKKKTKSEVVTEIENKKKKDIATVCQSTSFKVKISNSFSQNFLHHLKCPSIFLSCPIFLYTYIDINWHIKLSVIQYILVVIDISIYIYLFFYYSFEFLISVHPDSRFFLIYIHTYT